MKLLVVLSISVICANAKTLFVEEEWQNFKVLHGKFYRSILDEKRRYSIFQENLKKIEEHNALYDKGLETYKLGVTRFADLSSEEFKGFLTLKKNDRSHREGKNLFQVPKNADIPKTIDWRKKGAVTPVKDQGKCGACWAFSVTGSVEGQYFIKNNKLISFSEQQLIDCASNKYGTAGCDGGQFDPAFSYIKDNGIETEATYPFEMTDDKCRYSNDSIVTKITDYVDVKPNDEHSLVAAVGLVGPVSVAIDAEKLQLYKEGLYQSKTCSQTDLNHGILAVGYGSENGQDFWIVKNSWGLTFGEEGYVRMLRGVNQCGIALQPSYPVL